MATGFMPPIHGSPIFHRPQSHYHVSHISSYELGGCFPHQLSLLHASVAPLHAHFQAHILIASSTPHVAQLVRRIIEQTHQTVSSSQAMDHDQTLSLLQILNNANNKYHYRLRIIRNSNKRGSYMRGSIEIVLSLFIVSLVNDEAFK